MSTHWKLDFLMQCFNGPDLSSRRQKQRLHPHTALLLASCGAFSRDTSESATSTFCTPKAETLAHKQMETYKHLEQNISVAAPINGNLYL